MCLYWIRKYAKNIESKETPNTLVNVIGMDELHGFVERKNRVYEITLVSRDPWEIVGFDIAFNKSRERIQRLVDRSMKEHQYYPDAYSAYAEVRYEGARTSLKNKSQTYTVEGVNSDLRHYIPPLRRRPKYFFRSIETANTVFKIFVNAFNLFARAKKNFSPEIRILSLEFYLNARLGHSRKSCISSANSALQADLCEFVAK